MDKETLLALQASIEKWEKNATADSFHEVRISGDDCPLCNLFYERQGHCIGCPVEKETGSQNCYGTPYYAARGTYYDWLNRLGTKKAFQEKARNEVNYLKSLLPEELK